MKNFVSYLRVSTTKQGVNGLGIEGQRQSIETYLNGGDWNILKEFVEVESGKKNDRKELQKAINFCRNTSSTLIISKLDRLSRNVAFVSSLMESKIDFVCCDMPDANRLTIHIIAALAEWEREQISIRTKAALKVLKSKGVKLGNDNLTQEDRLNGSKSSSISRSKTSTDFALTMYGIIKVKRDEGLSLRGICQFLNDEGYRTSRKGEWKPNTVKRVIEKVENINC